MTVAARGYPTKKALKASIGQPFRYTETAIAGREVRGTGHESIVVVGPEPYVRKWYAQVTLQDGIIEDVT